MHSRRLPWARASNKSRPASCETASRSSRSPQTSSSPAARASHIPSRPISRGMSRPMSREMSRPSSSRCVPCSLRRSPRDTPGSEEGSQGRPSCSRAQRDSSRAARARASDRGHGAQGSPSLTSQGSGACLLRAPPLTARASFPRPLLTPARARRRSRRACRRSAGQGPTTNSNSPMRLGLGLAESSSEECEGRPLRVRAS
mmetsp:Transcript_30331/g.43402  ORF Transcript_30331/g.43402 Transcript_30331/m.43402 type:complete len:201 (-) Transcript_30331:1736-2338(-)